MSLLHKKMEFLSEKKNISVYKACKDMKIPITFYSDLKSGKAKACSTERALTIAQYFGVSVDYLLGNTNQNENTPAPKKGRGVKIPVLGIVPAGIPIEAVEDVIDYEEITPELAETGDYFALQIKGDSMEPRITDGDVVIVRKQEYADTGDTVIVLINGENATCKRIKITKEGLTLISTNTAYDPMFFTPKEVSELPVLILGRVVELRAKF